MRLSAHLLRSFVFVDTSAFYALADRTDRLHASAKRFVESNTALLVTSNLVIHETITLIRMRLGHEAAVKFGRRLFDEHVTPVLWVTPRDERAAWATFQRYRDKQFSFTDCSSFALMQRLGVRSAFAFDEDFRQSGRWMIYPTEPDL